MASIARAATRKVFERNLQNYEPKDPLYETYVDSKGRERRRKVRTVWRGDRSVRLTADLSARNPTGALEARREDPQVRAEAGALSGQGFQPLWLPLWVDVPHRYVDRRRMTLLCLDRKKSHNTSCWCLQESSPERVTLQMRSSTTSSSPAKRSKQSTSPPHVLFPNPHVAPRLCFKHCPPQRC